MFLKGNFLYTPSRTELTIRENQYAHIENGIVTGFTTSLPESAGAEKVIDYGQDIIIPAFVDLHIHAPQYINRGLGFDEELLPWLEGNLPTLSLPAAFTQRSWNGSKPKGPCVSLPLRPSIKRRHGSSWNWQKPWASRPISAK